MRIMMYQSLLLSLTTFRRGKPNTRSQIIVEIDKDSVPVYCTQVVKIDDDTEGTLEAYAWLDCASAYS